eukprot:1581905-Rhodomonas_salina.1
MTSSGERGERRASLFPRSLSLKVARGAFFAAITHHTRHALFSAMHTPHTSRTLRCDAHTTH